MTKPRRRAHWIAITASALAIGVWLTNELLIPNPTAAMPRAATATRLTTITPGTAALRALPRAADTPRIARAATPAVAAAMRSPQDRTPPTPELTAGTAPNSRSQPAPIEPAAPPAEPIRNWVHHEVQPGETLGGIFTALELDAGDALKIAELNDGRLRRLIPGDTLRLDVERGGRLRILEYSLGPIEYLSISRDGEDFVPQRLSRDFEVQERRISGHVRSSLFQAGSDAGLSNSLILEFASIFRWTIDFARELHSGDEFTLIYEEKIIDGRVVDDGSIVAGMLINNGTVHRAIRHDGEDGRVAYYSPDGNSLQRAFLRTPVSFARISSNFSQRRYHPVLKTWRSHKGVDYAAATGTPVHATGEGKVVLAGRKGGYGKTVIIKHAGRRDTLYAHLSGFRKGLRTGQKIGQGDILGYVGSTGLATGPHLHYEFRINGTHRDPLSVELPRSVPIPAGERSDFLARAALRVAELEQQRGLLLTEIGFDRIRLD